MLALQSTRFSFAKRLPWQWTPSLQSYCRASWKLGLDTCGVLTNWWGLQGQQAFSSRLQVSLNVDGDNPRKSRLSWLFLMLQNLWLKPARLHPVVWWALIFWWRGKSHSVETTGNLCQNWKKSLSFTLRSTDVFWMLWTGRLAERVVIMHDKQNQSKPNCANLRIMLLSVFWLLWFHECAAHLSLCDVESGKHWQWSERRALKKAVFVLKHLSAAVITDA